METETLVEALATDKIVPWTLERSIRLALIAGNIIAGIMFFGGIGFRPDIVFAMGTTRFLVKFAVTLPLALAATAAMLRAAQPGASFGVRGWALALSPIILISAVLIELVTVPPPLWGSKIIGTHAQNCLTLIPLLSIGPRCSKSCRRAKSIDWADDGERTIPSCTRGFGRAAMARLPEANARNLFRRSTGYADARRGLCGSDGSRAFALRGR